MYSLAYNKRNIIIVVIVIIIIVIPVFKTNLSVFLSPFVTLSCFRPKQSHEHPYQGRGEKTRNFSIHTRKENCFAMSPYERAVERGAGGARAR